MTVRRVASATSPRGETVLLRRENGALELRVNGVFVMDTLHTASERELARVALEAPAAATEENRPLAVLVGGLGLGFTLHEVLANPRVDRVLVAELEPAVVEWFRQGLVPELASDRFDERAHLVSEDVTALVSSQREESLDVVLLDVDNGPGYLVHSANSTVYDGWFLTECRSTLRPSGVLAVWSAAPAPELAATMRTVFDRVDHREIPVKLGTTETEYHLYLGHR
ncbi:hypothetical protein CEP50_05650 [Actinopolyspora mortivallis]|uniref:Spermidine synthase n=1 Tax=Actinopolyspora mortivallis TaxID=33906 RepID=A0A2T0GZ75_ACTMO|nr:hypothetical protein CEP50_05650 [Actinopolyspora mortivallis]